MERKELKNRGYKLKGLKKQNLTLSNRGHAQKSNQDLIVFKVFKQTNERTILMNFGIHSDMQHFLLKAHLYFMGKFSGILPESYYCSKWLDYLHFGN